jgi:hypothetical protein
MDPASPKTSSITGAVRKLRRALGDNSEAPRLVTHEDRSLRGDNFYRFWTKFSDPGATGLSSLASVLQDLGCPEQALEK